MASRFVRGGQSEEWHIYSLLRRTYGRPHSCQTQGPVQGGPGRALCCLPGHSWVWANSLSNHCDTGCNIKVLISPQQPLITSSPNKYSIIYFSVPAYFFSGSWGAAASLSGRHRNCQSLIFIMWLSLNGNYVSLNSGRKNIGTGWKHANSQTPSFSLWATKTPKSY